MKRTSRPIVSTGVAGLLFAAITAYGLQAGVPGFLLVLSAATSLMFGLLVIVLARRSNA